jgi:hypothetical protein
VGERLLRGDLRSCCCHLALPRSFMAFQRFAFTNPHSLAHLSFSFAFWMNFGPVRLLLSDAIGITATELSATLLASTHHLYTFIPRTLLCFIFWE